MEDLTGKILGGRYRVETFLGRGGMADVYKVWDQQRAAHLALKVLHTDLAEDLIFLRRFKREALMLARLQHPNIVRFYGLEEADGLAFILMDFIEGLTLRKEIFLSKGGIRPARVLQILQPVCSALHFAHQMGLVHCDIKPANILIHRNGIVYLTDFGIARMTESRTQTMTGAGTPAYMAPEQATGAEPSLLTDIYALGVVLFEMLTGGERPFTGDSGQATGSTTQRIVWEKCHLPAPSPARYNPRVPAELAAVTLRCLERDPSARFESVLQLAQALEYAVHGDSAGLEIQTLTDFTPVEYTPHPEPVPEAEAAGPVVQAGDNYQARRDFLPVERDAQETEESLPEPPDQARSPGSGLPGALKNKNGPGNAAGPGLSVRFHWPRNRKRRLWTLVATGALALLVFFAALVATRPGSPVTALSSTGARTLTRNATLPAGETQVAGASRETGASGEAGASEQAGASLEASAASIPGIENQASTATSTPTPVATETPQPQPTVLGGGSSGKIAFASDRSGSVQIWVMDAGNPEIREQITNVAGGACQPAWSPDGTRLSFITPCKGPRLTYPGARLNIIDLATREITPLPIPFGAFDAAWSPDGETIAYTTYNDTKTEIHAIDLTTMRTYALSVRGRKNNHPAWSPDGEFIAFTSDDNGIDEIWRMRKDGGSQEVLTQAGPLKYFSRPVWSPDGKWLMAAMKELNAPGPMPVQVLLERANPRKGETRLTGSDVVMENASFSPDGQWVVYWAIMEGSNLEIWRISLDGKTERLTDHKGRDFHPAWFAR